MAIKMTKKDIFYFVITSLVILVVGLGLLIYYGLPKLSEFRNSIYGWIVDLSLLAVIILCITLSRKIGMPLLGKITVWCYCLLFILLSIFDLGKIEMFFLFIYAVLNVCVTIFLYFKKGIAYKSIWLFGALSYFSSIVVVLNVNYLSGDLVPAFMMIAIIVSIIAFTPCLIYGINQFKLYRDSEKLIGLPLLALIGTFIFVWLTITAMNVYFDTSDPAYEEYIITEKYISSGSKQITTYNLEVKNGDTVFKIGVSETSYYSHEVNDTIMLSIYDGAFNEPYYIEIVAVLNE